MPFFPPIQQDQYPATAATQCLQIIIPDGDEFKALLAGLMVSASDVNNYADPSSAAADGLAAVWDQAYSEIVWDACPVPEDVMLNIDIFCCNGAAGPAGTFTYFSAAWMPFPFVMFTDNTANRYITNTVWLKAGIYAYTGWYSKSSSSGITDIDLYDASGFVDSITSGIDQYNAAFNARFSASGTVNVPSDGFYTILAFNKGSKNVASGGFAVNWTSHHIRQTS